MSYEEENSNIKNNKRLHSNFVKAWMKKYVFKE